jgi:hypothetical protein
MLNQLLWFNLELRAKLVCKIKPFKNLKLNKKLNKKHFLINLPMKKSKEKPNLSKTLNLRLKLPMLKKKDNKKKFLLRKEQLNLKSSKRKKLSKNLKLKRKSKSSSLPKLSKRLKLPLPRKLQPKLILLE